MALREIGLNMGPQHPSTHGVLRLKLAVDNEVVLRIEPVLGYLHRGMEKLWESLTYAQIVPLTDRLDYLASLSNNLAYCLTVEKLAGIDVPKRARHIRVILAELQRLASHLAWTGFMANDIGAMSVLLYGFEAREDILDVFEEYCGARLTVHGIRIGGVIRDLDPRWSRASAPSSRGSPSAWPTSGRCSTRTGSGRSGRSASAASRPRRPSTTA